MSAGCFIFARNFLVYSIFAWVRNWFLRPPLTTYLLAHLPALPLHYRQTTWSSAPLTMASFLSDRFCHYLVHYFYFSYYDLRLCTWLASFLSVLFSRTSLSRARVWSRSPCLLYDLRNLCSEFSTQPCHLDGTCFCQLNKILRILKNWIIEEVDIKVMLLILNTMVDPEWETMGSSTKFMLVARRHETFAALHSDIITHQLVNGHDNHWDINAFSF